MSTTASDMPSYASQVPNAKGVIFCVLAKGTKMDMQMPASCSCRCGMPFPEDPRGSFMAPLPEGVRCLVCDDASCEWPVSRIIMVSYKHIHGGDGSVLMRNGASIMVLSADSPVKCRDDSMFASSSSASMSAKKSCLTCGNRCNNPVASFAADQTPDEVRRDLLRIAAELKM